MNITKLALAACAAVLMAPALANASVKFESFYVAGSTRVDLNGANKSDDRSKTYNSISPLLGGVSKDASSAISKAAGSATADSTTSATLFSKKVGIYSFSQEVSASTSKPSATADAHAQGEIDYQFTLGGKPHDITLTGGVGGASYLAGGGNFHTYLLDDNTGAVLGDQFTEAGQSFDETLYNLSSGTYDLITKDLGTKFDTETYVPGALSPSANTGAKFSFSIATAAVPEPETWALMMLGLFGAGALLRNRRQHATALA